MVVVRLARGGSHNRPFYSIVVTDSRSPRDGRFIEKIGFYNPLASEGAERVRVDLARVDYWVQNGAQLSPAVARELKAYNKISPAAAA